METDGTHQLKIFFSMGLLLFFLRECLDISGKEKLLSDIARIRTIEIDFDHFIIG